MTKSTDKKNIEKIVVGILESNSIDNLKLQIDLVSAWWRYVAAREDGMTPAESRERIAAEFDSLGFSSAGQERNQVRQEFQDVMRLDFGSEDNAEWKILLNFLVERKREGENIAQYLKWCKDDPYNSPKLHQIAVKPLLVKQTWRMAFYKAEEESLEDLGWK